MKRVLIASMIILFGLTSLKSQGMNEDNSVLYMKANVLLEAGRYDEAVRMYNRILKADEHHTNALFMRSKAKYELGAYRGTKNDIMTFIEKAGVTKEVIKLMANTEFNLSNLVAAKNYTETAIELDPYDDVMHLLAGDINMESGSRNDACESYHSASELGNQKAIQRMAKRCNGYRPKKPRVVVPAEVPVVVEEGMDESDKMDEQGEEVQDVEVKEERKEGEIVSLEEIVREAENAPDSDTSDDTNVPTRVEEVPQRQSNIDMDASQEIVIDDMLYITFENGLGDRKLATKPSIFMLSDQDGKVVIDVCVDSDGTVSEATFNRAESTIFRSSLTSLALRKAKQFSFEGSREIEQCGTMIYNIKS